MTNKAQGIGGLVIAAVYAGAHFAQPHHEGASGEGQLAGAIATVAIVAIFGGFGLYKLRKR
jgi:hypothetical protein